MNYEEKSNWGSEGQVRLWRASSVRPGNPRHFLGLFQGVFFYPCSCLQGELTANYLLSSQIPFVGGKRLHEEQLKNQKWC